VRKVLKILFSFSDVDFKGGYRKRGVDWIEMAQKWSKRRIRINKVTNLQVPKNAMNFLTSVGAVSFSKMTLRLRVY
jgi:Ni,Fe-hydrogenase III large subunit